MAQASSTSSESPGDTCVDLSNAPTEIAALDNETAAMNTDDSGKNLPFLTESENQFNIKMKKLFETPTVQQLFPCNTMELLNDLCTQILAEAKKVGELFPISQK